jgi:hypothetical protein
MKLFASLLVVFLMFLCSVCVLSPRLEAQSPLYELRIYQPFEGKQKELLGFIEKHGMSITKANGIEILGAFVPSSAEDDRIVTLVRHKDRESCDRNYEKMMADPETRAAFQEAFPSGPPVQSLTRVFLRTTDYSPALPQESLGNRVFELRSYIASSGNLESLNARFRNHTMKLFAKHGMNNLIYWNVDDGGEMKAVDLLAGVSPKNQAAAEISEELPSQGNALVYFLTHASQDAAKGSFDAFRQDPDWVAVRTESEKRAGGSLTAGSGVKSWFLKPTDFSPLK